MSELSLAYIFHHQQLLVDENLQLPKVEKLASDISFNSGDQIIARDLFIEDQIPAGYQLIPIRQLISQWTKSEFEQASRAVQLLEWRRNHKFCSHCGHETEVHPTEYAMVCPSCRYHQYPRVQPCIITVITRGDNEILLAKMLRIKARCMVLLRVLLRSVKHWKKRLKEKRWKKLAYMSKMSNIYPANLGLFQVILCWPLRLNMNLVKSSCKKKKLVRLSSLSLISYPKRLLVAVSPMP